MKGAGSQSKGSTGSCIDASFCALALICALLRAAPRRRLPSACRGRDSWACRKRRRTPRAITPRSPAACCSGGLVAASSFGSIKMYWHCRPQSPWLFRFDRCFGLAVDEDAVYPVAVSPIDGVEGESVGRAFQVVTPGFSTSDSDSMGCRQIWPSCCRQPTGVAQAQSEELGSSGLSQCGA
jgi:hypothetical protein